MNDRRKKFLEANMVVIDEDINLDMARYVDESISHFQISGNPEIEVVINSNGGDVDLGLHIFDMIDTYRGKTSGRVVAFARSMGAIILQACTAREAGRHSKILIHHVSRKQVSIDVLKDPLKLADLIRNMERTQEKLYKILEGRSKQAREDIITACLSDTDMTADEALARCLIDKITDSSPKGV